MTSYGSRKDMFSLENGWMTLDDLLQGLARSIQTAQDKLHEAGDSKTHLQIKDIRMDMPMEVHHEAETSETRVRLPSVSLQMNGDVKEAHISRFQFTLGHVIKHEE
ncbi:hypothetical protein SD71_16220 [Cohnella kolymensis]|uniref:Uncharacterized protein n=1 Tax=Cohnella kolymensis TaxID=1590652 RepID=A0ABR5A298_9BACL|nr:hypothetical protein [Cohnella kolymensis]KIL35169.1 hypothetical protein SD71_16220 [Cohnella kolymensis]